MASTVLPNGIIVPEKFSRDWYADLYHNWQELDNLLGGGTPKDGTLTIQKNGTAVGTFSANQATDETVNIEVPTKTSDLNNDSGFITGVSWNDVSDKPTFATVATSGSYDDLNNKPTIPTVNNATLTIQQNGTTVDTFTANSSSDKTVNIECVDLNSNQTVGGIKTFSNGINNKREQQFIFNKEYSDATDAWLAIHNYLDKNSTRIGFYSIGDFSGNRCFRWFVRGQSTNSVEVELFGFGRKRNETSYMYINATLETDLIPTYNNSISLGTSTNKWKSFNGVEPSGLSLPSDTSITIDTTGFAWGRNFTFTPSVNGHLFINIGNTNGIKSLSLEVGRGEYYFTNQTGILRFTFPVYKNKLVTILVNSSMAETVVPSLTLFPCQGNV